MMLLALRSALLWLVPAARWADDSQRVLDDGPVRLAATAISTATSSSAPEASPASATSPSEAPWQLNFSSPAPHLFAATYTLLQQWSNTIFPNGHVIAPCEIPAYTLFYHGRAASDTPPSPEWLAFDIEMAYGITGSTRNSFMLTYQTTRPVKCLYFDGESAALMGLGQLDTQMLHLYGNVSGPPYAPNSTLFAGLGSEYARAAGLCRWLRDAGLGRPGWGFEGVVRMNAGFELIWCDFTSTSLRLLTRLNVTAPQLPAGSTSSRGVAAVASGEGGHRDHSDSVGSDDDDDGDPPSRTSLYPLPPPPTRTDRSSSPSRPPVPPNWRTYMGPVEREPFLRAQGWGWFLSATYHYGSTRAGPGLGEARARILSCGVASYYSRTFANQSLNRAIYERKALNLTDDGRWTGPGHNGNATWGLMQLGRRRRFHHLEGVTRREAATMKTDLKAALQEVLQGDGGKCSGADWVLMTNEIVQRTAGYLKTLEQHLGSLDRGAAGNATLRRRWTAGARELAHAFAVGYFEFPPDAAGRDAWRPGSEVYREAYARCRLRYTRLLAEADLPPAEAELRWAVEETFGTICAVLLRLTFEVELVWEEEYSGRTSADVERAGEHSQRLGPGRLQEHDRGQTRAEMLQHQAQRWTNNVTELVAWLGWEGEYLSCSEACAWHQRCFIPMWPLLRSIWGGRRPPPARNGTYPRPPMGRRPGYGPGPGYGRNGSDYYGPGYGRRPPWTMPPRGPWWMGDDRDLWAPRCVDIADLMGEV